MIIIPNILTLEFAFLGFEERHPSYNFSVVGNFYCSNKLSISLNIKSVWFEATVLKMFSRSLNNDKPQTLSLVDMSSEIVLTLNQLSNGGIIFFEIFQRQVGGSSAFKYEKELNLDELYIFKKGLDEMIFSNT